MTGRLQCLALIPMLAGCLTLTPQQTAGLKDAPRFADEVTTAYGSSRIRVIADADRVSGYRAQTDFITMRPDPFRRATNCGIFGLALSHPSRCRSARRM
jgi:hypothetical protein